jgi:hypothetical protein
MAGDYERLIARAAALPAPAVSDLPSHFTDDYSGTSRAITARFGLGVDDILGARKC